MSAFVTSDLRVTWLMAVRNGMPFLSRTLASIQGQTYPNSRLLVWDNGSTDGTVEELRRWIPSRIAGQIITDRPLSLGLSRAALVEAADTELCASTDADDISDPERLERQVGFLQAHPEAVLVGSQVQVIDESDRPLPLNWAAPTDDAEVRWATRWRPKNLHPVWLFRRSKVLQAGNYRDCRPIEDHDLLIRLSLLGHMPNLPETLLQYRRHGASVTASVEDHQFYERKCAEMNAQILFPGIRPDRALYLWDLLYPWDFPHRQGFSEPRSPADILLLMRASKSLALALGKEESYFRSTDLYSRQNYHVRTRCYEKLGLAQLVGLRRRMKRLFHGRAQ